MPCLRVYMQPPLPAPVPILCTRPPSLGLIFPPFYSPCSNHPLMPWTYFLKCLTVNALDFTSCSDVATTRLCSDSTKAAGDNSKGPSVASPTRLHARTGCGRQGAGVLNPGLFYSIFLSPPTVYASVSCPRSFRIQRYKHMNKNSK